MRSAAAARRSPPCSSACAVEVKARRAGNAAEAVGPERVAGLSRAADWLADSRGYEWVQRVRLDLVTIDGLRVRYVANAFRL